MGGHVTRALRLLVRERDGRLGVAFCLALLLFAVLAPLAAPDPNRIEIRARFQAPSLQHPLGTDNLGRDLLARVAVGTRTALSFALLIIAASCTLGVVTGMAAGLAGGWGDRLVLALFDIVSAFPTLILAFACIALVGPGPVNFVLLTTVVFIPQFGRMARARTRSLAAQSFVEAERLLGLPPLRIALVHVLPNVIGPILVLAAMNVPVVITFEAGLSFLGLGVQPPRSSLGTLIKDGFVFMSQSALPVIDAAAVLAIATLGSTLLGEAVRRLVDPQIARSLRA